MTRVIAIDPVHPDPAAIAAAAAVLRAGGLVAFPTETVYGLGANALDARAVTRIFAAKERPASDPLIVHLAAAADLGRVARDLPPIVTTLADACWPGPLTLVLPRTAAVPANVTAGGAHVAVRVPDHPVALALIRAAGCPVAAPSANRFTRPSPTQASHVLADLAGRIDLLLDGGQTTIGVESSVVDLTCDPPHLLRAGGMTFEQLRAFLPQIIYAPRYLHENELAEAPGQLVRHYAPHARLLLFDGAAAAVQARLRAEIAARPAATVGLLLMDDDLARVRTPEVASATLGTSAETAALRLFGGLRALDDAGVHVIFARLPGDNGLWRALRDRLTRAAEGRVILIADEH